MRAEDHPADLGHCLVTGAAGYLGRNLCWELVRRGCRVRGFDLRPVPPPCEGIESIVGDVTNEEQVHAACLGIDTVFHTAAVLNFLQFENQAGVDRCHAVNVTGTQRVLRMAQQAGAKRLISTSSNNVCFDGREIVEGDESSPYAEDPADLYTATKLQGELAVLQANDPEGLLTCAIRPGGIFGPGEEHFLPMLVEQCVRGRFVAILGDGLGLSDNTFIDNLVDGQIQAARHLIPNSPVCGQAYFITDGHPINYFEFFRPLVEGMGVPFPRYKVPIAPLEGLALMAEWLHAKLGTPPPPLSALELRKVATTHTFRIDKAKRDFGWEPKVGIDEVWKRLIVYCKELQIDQPWRRS